jgi:hypothetical protein
MRSFKDILTESKKVYSFKIGVAGDLPEGCEDGIKTCLKKFEVANITSGKKTPIQERPLDFPQLQNMEVTYWEVDVNYPTKEYQDTKDDAPYEAMLDKEDMGGESAQESVGGNRVMELLKELETARKERDNDPMESAPVGESKDIDDSENAKSPIGS